jgi:methylmalonyl-CoA/ethylmalonyl-CoA epimerase
MSSINHVAAVVGDLESAIRILTEGFGFRAEPITEIREVGARVAFLQAANTRIELIQPVASGPYLEFLEKGQLGFNHIAIEVGEMRSALEKLEGIGIRPKGSPITGAKGRVQNLDLSTTADLRLQIFESSQ